MRNFIRLTKTSLLLALMTSSALYAPTASAASTVVKTTGPNAYCIQEVTPMTNNAAAVVADIDKMTAGGDTFISTGLAWGWRMLSPKWRGLWGGTMDADSLPKDYATPHMTKAIVLLTDGKNNFAANNYTTYDFLSKGRLNNTTNSTTAYDYLNDKTEELCTQIKAHGINVYVVALDTGGAMDTATRDMLKACATMSSYYFYAPAASDLAGIFGKIGDSLSNLRVSK